MDRLYWRIERLIMEKNRETFMKECWDQYLATQDIQFLIDAVEEAPFFGQKEMAMEISRQLKTSVTHKYFKDVKNSLDATNRTLEEKDEEKTAKEFITVLEKISNYFGNKSQTINLEPLLRLGAEIANISNGVKQEFIKSHRIGKGQSPPKNIHNHMKKAAITALTEIIMLSDEFKKPAKAREKLNVLSGIPITKLKDARDQYLGNRLDEAASNECEKWINMAKNSNEYDREGFIRVLLGKIK